jgi:hypothetical protein
MSVFLNGAGRKKKNAASNHTNVHIIHSLTQSRAQTEKIHVAIPLSRFGQLEQSLIQKTSFWKTRFPSIYLNIIFVYSSPVSWIIFRNHVISAYMQYALGTDFMHKVANTV